ncbi:MAG: hypothetical protein EOM20_03675 [Spartobacteria bacterium]|nr:hypothetical protein [Spartobacteria bacterium]
MNDARSVCCPLIKVARALKAEILYQPHHVSALMVCNVTATDLMSDVLVVDKDNILLVTSLASDQAIRTAHIIGAVAVIIANGKNLPSSMLQVAEELDICVLRTQLPKFETCAILSRMLRIP